MKKVVLIFIGLIAALWVYSLVVTEPPYGLKETPQTVDEVTLQEVTEIR